MDHQPINNTPPGNMRMQAMNQQAAAQKLMKYVLSHMDDYPNCICASCGCKHFDRTNIMKKVSALDPNNPFKSEQYINFGIWICKKCGTEIYLGGPNSNILEEMPEGKA